jgi:hypothetical protein
MLEIYLEQILQATNALCLLSGNSIYFGIGKAKEVVEWLTRNEFIILGFEGFKTNGCFIEPSLDFIADFSCIDGTKYERLKRCHDFSLDILAQWINKIEFIEFSVKKID